MMREGSTIVVSDLLDKLPLDQVSLPPAKD